MADMAVKYDDFAKLDLRIATVVECKVHPNADKLLLVQLDLGVEKRQVCAGLREYYAPEQLVGKQVIIVANLEPRAMRGEMSNGMLLATTDSVTGRVLIVSPAENVAPGSIVK